MITPEQHIAALTMPFNPDQPERNRTMANEVFEAMTLAREVAPQPLIRACRGLKVGHVLTPDEVDDLRAAANWMEGTAMCLAIGEDLTADA